MNFQFSYGVTGSRDSDQALIGFDMGGTSTDVSRFADGKYEHVVESTTAGITIQASQLDINTVAAGGGSMLFFRSGLFVVGPESASGNSIHLLITWKSNPNQFVFVLNFSAHPGPACYRKGEFKNILKSERLFSRNYLFIDFDEIGGPLTVTDANLILGRLLPEYFPKIFGPNENEALDYEITKQKFKELQIEINKFLLESGQRTVRAK